MDTGEGRFREFEKMEELPDLQSEHPNHGGVFTVGEEIELKGSRFRVKHISPKELRLKLLPKNKQRR